MSLLRDDMRAVMSWEAAHEEMGLEATAKDSLAAVTCCKDCFRYEGWQPEKLNHPRLTAAC